MATKPEKAETPEPKKSKKMLFIIVGAVLVLAIGGAAAFMLMRGREDAHDEQASAESKTPVFVVIDPFVVNLQEEDGVQYLQAALTLQVPDAATAETIKTFMPQVRSRLLMALSSKKASELLTSEGKRNLTDEIIDQLGEPFANGSKGPAVTDVFYTSFVIQEQ